jgi:2-keto-4-pentenoate hydratase/2-oxohepta-3-ene-1,7-dioic acid hydratase in catechol pathway
VILLKLATIKIDNKEKAAILIEKGAIILEDIKELGLKNSTLLEIISMGKLNDLNAWYQRVGNEYEPFVISYDRLEYAPLYRNPRKIWGIGMNYHSVKTELGSLGETDPVLFMKPDTSLIGPCDSIVIPAQSKRTTAEAELAIIIGEKCKNMNENEVSNVIAGFTTAIDVTAADIHAENPRYLQRAKSFDTFFSFGPVFLSNDEIEDLSTLHVQTALNGQVIHKNKVENMIYSPAQIVSFLSQVSTLLPGDIILTGTPGATIIQENEVIECRIDGFEALVNSVR